MRNGIVKYQQQVLEFNLLNGFSSQVVSATINIPTQASRIIVVGADSSATSNAPDWNVMFKQTIYSVAKATNVSFQQSIVNYPYMRIERDGEDLHFTPLNGVVLIPWSTFLSFPAPTSGVSGLKGYVTIRVKYLEIWED